MMKVIAIALYSVIILAAVSFGQPLEDWQSTVSNPLDERMIGMCSTGDGGFIAAGIREGGTFDEGYLARFAPNGSLVWVSLYGFAEDVRFEDVCLLGAGPEYLAVGTQGFITGESDILMIRFNGDTGELLEDTIYNNNFNDVGHAIEPAFDGGYIIAGESSGAGHIIRLDSNLTLSLVTSYGPDTSQGFLDAKPTADGGVIACGFIWEGTDFFDANEFWIVKLDQFGSPVWENRSGGWGDDEAVSVIETPGGNFIAAGTRYDNLLGADDNQLWAMMVNSFGATQWVSYFGSPAGEEFGSWVDVAPTGFYLGGYGTSAATNGYDCWLINISGNGGQLWNQIYGGPGDQYGYAWANLGNDRIGVSGQTPIGPSMDAWGMRLVQPADLLVSIFPVDQNMFVPANGGTFQYQVIVENTSANLINHDAWIQIEHVETNNSVETRFFPNTNFPAQQSVSAIINQTVPGNAPSGSYEMTLFIGNHPWEAIAFGSFFFNKSGFAADDFSVFDRPELWATTGSFDVGDGRVFAGEEVLPSEFILSPAYPNPFNPSTTLSLNLPDAAELTVAVFNVTGQQVAELANGQFAAGSHKLTFDASHLSGGVYFVHSSAGDWNAVQKVVLVK
jgi:Secretion system C-terminal sorting domain